MNFKGFSLVELVVAFVIAFFCLIAVIKLFQINGAVYQNPLSSVERTNAEGSLDIAKGIILDSRVYKNGEYIDGTKLDAGGIIVKTTYFNNNYVNPDTYSLTCKDGKLVGQKNNEAEQIAVGRTTKCSFKFLDKNNQEVTDGKNVKSVKLNVQFRPSEKSEPIAKEFTVRMRQNT